MSNEPTNYYKSYLQELIKIIKLKNIDKKIPALFEIFQKTGIDVKLTEEDLKERIAQYKTGNISLWAELLVNSAREDWSIHNQLKELSPFKDKMLVKIKYGDGIGSVEGDFIQLFSQIIDQEGMCTFDGDCYYLSYKLPKKLDIHWSGNHLNRQNFTSPNKNKRKEEKKKCKEQ